MKFSTKHWIMLVIGLFFLIAAAWFVIDYLALFQKTPISATYVNEVIGREGIVATNTESAAPVPYKIELVAEGLFVPWSIVFTNGIDRMLVSERSGEVRVIENGKLQEKPLHTFQAVSSQAEEGLMGLALDPEYATNKFVYACMALGKGESIKDQLVRFTDEGDRIDEIVIILDDIPAARFHAGCRIAFGPDKKLYVTTGDATDKNIAQDPQSLGGKILRLNADGSVPTDNPIPGSLVYSLGHRNPQGIAWHPESGALLETEHGPSTFDGPAGGDEINLIQPGKNYGWPIVSHEKSRDGLVSPLEQFTPAVAPGSALVYSGKIFPQFKNHLLFGALKGEGIYDVTFTDASASKIAKYEKLTDVAVGRVRDIVEAPDGSMYFTTSNRDGRGMLRTGDDRVYRLVPKK